MIKKLCLLILALLPICGKAQQVTGSWEVYPNFLTVDKIVQTSNKVYTLSSGSLMSIDLETDEVYNYGIHNVLSEAKISDIFYNKKGNYLAVTYSTGNIDIVKNDGNVINLPDIKDAVLQTTRNINDIAFGDGRMYVATNFGIVVYDDKRWEVKESGIYNEEVKYIGVTDKYIAAYFPKLLKMGFVQIGKSLRYIDNFSQFEMTSCSSVRGMKGGIFQCSTSPNIYPHKMIYDGTGNNLNFEGAYDYTYYNGIYEGENGCYMYNTTVGKPLCIKYIDEDFNITTIALPDNMAGKSIAFYDNPEKIFIADDNGIGQVAYDNAGNITTLREQYHPEAISAQGVGCLTAGDSGKIYVSAHGFSMIYGNDWSTKRVISHVNILENNRIYDATPNGMTLSQSDIKYEPGYKDGTYRITDTYEILEDPDDPDAYFISSLFNGLYKVDKTGKELAYYNETNSTMRYNWVYFQNNAIDVDAKGNLWVASHGKNGFIHMLPAEKRRLNGGATEADWLNGFTSEGGAWDKKMVACKKSNIVVAGGRSLKKLVVIDHNGTVTQSDDKYYEWETFLDQDGKEISLSNELYCMVEDEKGQIWVGTDKGPYIIPNPKRLTDPSMRVQRIKVPRNDGTNFADYLLEGEPILSIAVDGVNRKWLGTANSGVYLVSENGSQIINNFTVDNSYLPLNKVCAIACDKKSNAVYFGTTAGLVKYNSDAAPASEDYSDVYAYPNPVRPEYSGWITVTGLMDDSLVKIADASGNVFFQGTSQGGMITWDGCDASGNRVKTGVYYVFASQNASGSSSGAVTKILVVK